MARYKQMRTTVVAVSLLIAANAAAAEKQFRARDAGKYPAHQNQADVTVGVRPYRAEKETREAFGKAKPYKYGVLPILVVITNASDHPLGLENLKVRFITSDREGLEPVSAEDLAYFQPSTKPKELPRYIPRVPGIGRPRLKKGPLAKWEITERAFTAPVVPPKSSASGFFYYLTGRDPDPIPGSAIYLSGVRDLTSGQELFYFEIPLDKYKNRK